MSRQVVPAQEFSTFAIARDFVASATRSARLLAVGGSGIFGFDATTGLCLLVSKLTLDGVGLITTGAPADILSKQAKPFESGHSSISADGGGGI